MLSPITKQLILFLALFTYSSFTYAIDQATIIATLIEWEVFILGSALVIFVLLPKDYKIVVIAVLFALVMLYLFYWIILKILR